MIGWIIVGGILLFLVWAFFYVAYRLVTMSALVLYSAGKMKTGNDLGEQMNKALKEHSMPNFFQFYWRLWRKK